MSVDKGGHGTAHGLVHLEENDRALRRLAVGNELQSWGDLCKVIIDHGVASEHAIISDKKDMKQLIAKCRMHMVEDLERRCKWRLCAMVKANTKTITIIQAYLIHIFESAYHYFRRMHNNSNQLANHIMEIVMKNRHTRASTLRDTTHALIHRDILYQIAHAAKKRCITRLDGSDQESFYLIPVHCQHILDRDPRATVRYSAPNGRFERLFVCPFATRHVALHLRPFVAFDGTHIKCAYPQISLLATSFDANNAVIILAYGMVPGEDGPGWHNFMTLLREAIPQLAGPRTVFILDREKDLLPFVRHAFPTHYYKGGQFAKQNTLQHPRIPPIIFLF